MKVKKTPLLVCVSCSSTSEEVIIFDHPDGITAEDMCVECADEWLDFEEYKGERRN